MSPMRIIMAAFSMVFGAIVGSGPAAATVQADGLTITDTQVGTGAEATPGSMAVVHYTGWVWVNNAKGLKFDSSYDRGQPFTFPLGAGRVIAGWDEGVVGMKVGGKRTLLVPPELGYGEAGAGGKIPPNATLLFEVELVDVK